MSKLKKGQWHATLKILKKSLSKDSLNIEALYVYTVLYFTPYYSGFNVDTANHYRKKTSQLFSLADPKSRERLKKFPIDSAILILQKKKIDSAAFDHAKNLDTEASYIHFLNHYPYAEGTTVAIELRDEAAFGLALKQNTHNAFQNFLEKYPQSHRANEAKQRFEKLLYEHETKNKTLNEYQRFAEQYPYSPYATNAIQKIYELTTLNGTAQSFELFIQSYPNHPATREAQGILFHIKLSQQLPIPIPDSLKSIYPIRDWMPLAESGKWGFMDETGKTTFQPSLPEIHEDYFCDPLQTDFIMARNAIISRDGSVIYSGTFKSVSDLGFGFLLIGLDSSSMLIHKNGRRLPINDLQEAFVLGSQFLACRNSDQWGIFSFTGFPIFPFSFNRIAARGHSAILTKSGKEIIMDVSNLIPFSQNKIEPLVADEIRSYGSKYFWIRNGALEKVIDENLNDVIPFDRHRIAFEAVGLVVRKNNYSYLKNWPTLAETPQETYTVAEPWLITRAAGEKPTLHYIPEKKTVTTQADSIWFDQSFAGVMKNDTVKLLQTATQSFIIPTDEKYTIKKSKDSVVFILTQSRNKMSVYLANTLEKVTTTTWPEVEPVLRNVFVIKEKGKQGLIDSKNKILLKPEYDALLYANGVITLLKDKKFGTFNPTTRKLLKPTFETNIINYNKDWVIGRKGNKLAFINEETIKKPVFEFDEITYWTDSLALVTLNGGKSLYSIFNKKIMFDNITTFQIINNSDSDRLAIFSQNSMFGLVSSMTGIILNPDYEELTYQQVNDEIILIGMRPVGKEEVEIQYLTTEGRVIRKLKTDYNTGYDILCDN